jgi:hypothetical protein
MRVTRTQFNDRSDAAADGSLDYAYVGAHFLFEDAVTQLSFRWYEDEPTAANLVEPTEWWRSSIANSALFRDAVKYLRDTVGVTRIMLLDPTQRFGYLEESVARRAAHKDLKPSAGSA